MSRIACLVLMTLSVAGCGTSGPSGSGFCDIARPIIVRRADQLTDRTFDAIVAHNETGQKLCDWRPPR